jgi:hypothetical protein
MADVWRSLRLERVFRRAAKDEIPRDIAVQIHDGVRAWYSVMIERHGAIPKFVCSCGARLFGRRSGGRVMSCESCRAVGRAAFGPGDRRRATITSETKIAVLVRDGPSCRHCAARVRMPTGPDDLGADIIEFDHFPTPVWRGGTGDSWNVVVACRRCNGQQGGRMGHQATKAYHG